MDLSALIERLKKSSLISLQTALKRELSKQNTETLYKQYVNEIPYFILLFEYMHNVDLYLFLQGMLTHLLKVCLEVFLKECCPLVWTTITIKFFKKLCFKRIFKNFSL